jgi:ABC-2 type transport system permease protein
MNARQNNTNFGIGTLAWFAHHESRLAWRDWVSMMTAGRRRRMTTVVIALTAFAAFMHLIAYPIVKNYAETALDPDKTALVVMTGMLALSWSLMASQAMESVTRAFYSRSDLDLILSSPAAATKLFAVRIATMALATALMALLLASPFINVLVALGGWRWLAAYAVVVAVSLTAMAFAVTVTIALFMTLGPKRTRLVAQVMAAVIGAACVIGLQLAAIQSLGSLSRTEILASSALVALAPESGSMFYWPARAAVGDLAALAAVLGFGMFLLGASIALLAPRFGDCALAAGGVSQAVARRPSTSNGFRQATPRRALRLKEWLLLRRDPWLVSQSLMQILYLVPPAVLLWQGFSEGAGTVVVLVPVLVMAAGQLAGGLAWLAISGEDAPELVATAPVAAASILRAKIEAVMGAIGLVFLPFVAAIALMSPWHAMVTVLGILAASAAAIAIQHFFRTQAKRSHFRRRQTSSRTATFAEAFSSIAWAGTAALAAAGTWLAVPAGVFAVAVLLVARLISPPQP